MATIKTITGGSGDDIFDLAFAGEPKNNWQYLIDGGTGGTDTLYFDDGSGGYADCYRTTGFTIGSAAGVNDHLANAAGEIIVSGASTGGTHLTFTLRSVEKLVMWDPVTNAPTTITLSYGPPADITSPAFSSATVNGTTLVMSYTDANNLDASHLPANGAFTVSGAVSGAHAVSTVSVDAAAKTVTLTLGTAVGYGESVTVAYNDPTAANDVNAIQDAAGNDAASLGATAVTNNTPIPADIIAPVFASAAVNGATLVMTYTEANTLDASHLPANGAFTVSGAVSGAHGVNSVSVDAAAHTVTLTLGTAVGYGESVTVAYNDPTAGNDVNAIQDAAGNDAASLAATTVTNNTPVPADVTAPVFASATVNGATLVLNYTEANTLDAAHLPANGAFTVSNHAVTGISVNGAAHTVSLTLGSAVGYNELVTVAYNDPTAGNDVNAIQDAAGNDAASFGATSVTNNTPVPADVTAPVFASAAVNGSTLVMTYTDANNLDSSNLPLAGAFSVSGSHGVSGVAVNGAAHTVTLTLGTAVINGEVVTVSYTDPTASNDVYAIQDSYGNDAASLVAHAVTNNTLPGADVTAPTVTTFAPADAATGVLIGSNIDVTFSELIQRGTGTIEIHSGSAAGALVASYNAASSPNISVSGSVLTINPSTDLGYNTHYYATFSPGSVKDLAGNIYAGTTSYDFTTADLALSPMIRNGVSIMPEHYTGAATAAGGAPINFQFIGDSSGEVVIGTANNDFINVAGGFDAVNAGAGNDVIDGGTESNFLTGGTGTDIFFVDGRGGVATWSTITDWQAGEQLSVWGWNPGTSRIVSWVQAGAAGYEGLTMHADLDNNGTIDVSVTFTGITSQAQLPTPLEFPGVLWFT